MSGSAVDVPIRGVIFGTHAASGGTAARSHEKESEKTETPAGAAVGASAAPAQDTLAARKVVEVVGQETEEEEAEEDPEGELFPGQSDGEGSEGEAVPHAARRREALAARRGKGKAPPGWVKVTDNGICRGYRPGHERGRRLRSHRKAWEEWEAAQPAPPFAGAPSPVPPPASEASGASSGGGASRTPPPPPPLEAAGHPTEAPPLLAGREEESAAEASAAEASAAEASAADVLAAVREVVREGKEAAVEVRGWCVESRLRDAPRSPEMPRD